MGNTIEGIDSAAAPRQEGWQGTHNGADFTLTRTTTHHPDRVIRQCLFLSVWGNPDGRREVIAEMTRVQGEPTVDDVEPTDPDYTDRLTWLTSSDIAD